MSVKDPKKNINILILDQCLQEFAQNMQKFDLQDVFNVVYYTQSNGAITSVLETNNGDVIDNNFITNYVLVYVDEVVLSNKFTHKKLTPKYQMIYLCLFVISPECQIDCFLLSLCDDACLSMYQSWWMPLSQVTLG